MHRARFDRGTTGYAAYVNRTRAGLLGALVAWLVAFGPAGGAPERGPAHVRTWLYYGGSYENIGIPASWMARHADFIEIGGDAKYANAFVAAGGKYAVAYTDPHLVPYCSGTTCRGPMGNLPESAWLHDGGGSRLHTSSGQDVLNPDSPVTQAGFRAYTASLVSGTRINMVFVDDTSPTFDPSYFDYKYGEQAAELTGRPNVQAYWLSGQVQLLASSVVPAIFNGGYGDEQERALLTAPNVAGTLDEGCAVNSSFRVNLTQGNPVARWVPSMNKLLQATALHRYAVCLNYDVQYGDPIADRMYGLASWWLTYDPTWSVAFPDFTAPDQAGGRGSQNFAEYAIVPAEPRRSAGANVETLRTATGAYAREFESCYQDGAPIGRCAAVVNPSATATVAMPQLAAPYAHSLVLDDRSAYNGGTATWGGRVPSSLPPETAVILRG